MVITRNSLCSFWRVFVLVLAVFSSLSMDAASSTEQDWLLPAKQWEDHPTNSSARPLKVCVLVEPSPFTYISGYSNRYQALCQHLTSSSFGDMVQVITADVVHPNPPRHWVPPATNCPNDSETTTTTTTRTIPIHYTKGIRCPGYKSLTLSLDWTFQIPRVLIWNRPDIIHVASPGLMVFPAIFWSRLLQIPLVCSYHTHLPMYVTSYFLNPWLAGLVQQILWFLIRIVCVSMADLTLVTSPQIQQDFAHHGLKSCLVWQKGIDTDRFHPRFFNAQMRHRMMGSNESPNTPNSDDLFLILYVGRLAWEKRLKDLKPILQAMPASTRLCFVGSGPQEQELRQYFEGTSSVFLGPLHGDELSQAFASADVFGMPSDSETLGFVVLESMASGVPVVAARAGGIPDLIEQSHNGFLCQPGNVSEFVTQMALLQQNSSLRGEMGRNAQKEMQRWSWEASMARLRNEQYKIAWENFSRRPLQRFWRWITSKGQIHPSWILRT